MVVGGSGVFGGLFVRELEALGASVIATCTSADTAAKIPSSKAFKLLLDLTSQGSIDTLAGYLNSQEQLDGIVVASGRVGFGSVTETTALQAQELANINYLSVANLLAKLTDNISRGRSPFVLVVTGVVAERAFPSMAAYCASKAAMSFWLQSYRQEVKRHGIRVVEARPGHTETGLATRPLFGQAPAMPQGMAPDHVVARMVSALAGEEQVIESTAF